MWNSRSIVLIVALSAATFSAKAQSDNDLKRAKRMADSLEVKKNMEASITVFRNFLDYLYPSDLGGFTSEIAIAEAPEEICKDIDTNPQLVYSPTPDVIHYEDGDISYGFVPAVDYSVVANRLSALRTAIPLHINETVKTYIDYYALKRRGYTMRLLEKRGLFFPMFEKHLRENDMPTELKYLSIVESALEPKALSRAGALGLWQFMPATGKIYGLKYNPYIDERMDPEKATIAACKYLKYLYNMFGRNWELALAAYNCGPGTVMRAIKKAGGVGDFWAIYNHLPRETRNYVPIFTAVTYIMSYAEEHNLIQSQVLYPIEAEVVYINQNLNLKDFARKLNVCHDDLKELNPELKKDMVHYTMKNYPLRIPADRMDYFIENREEILGTSRAIVAEVVTVKKTNAVESMDKIYHKIKTGESLNVIAHRYGVTTQQLKTWNNLNSNTIQAGRSLLIKKKEKEKEKVASVEEKVKETSKPEEALAKPSSLYHQIKSGESLNLIAKKYGVTVKDLMKWNSLESEKIHAGSSIVVNESAYSPKETKAVAKAEEVKASNVQVETKKAEAPPKPQAKSTHKVRQGDTLWGIASQYNININVLKKINNIANDKLQVGQTLVVSE